MRVRGSTGRLIASGALASALAATALGASASAAQAPAISAGTGCYVVGRPVALSGTGFAGRREYVVSVDGVYFGESKTRADGTFRSSLRPGGLGAGVAQQPEQLEVTDGTVARTRASRSRARPEPGSSRPAAAPAR